MNTNVNISSQSQINFQCTHKLCKPNGKPASTVRPQPMLV